MRGKSSSKQGKDREMEIENLKEQPHLSGAYIRSLVKQLSHNSRNNKDSSSNTLNLDENNNNNNNNVSINSNETTTQQSHPPQQYKKQVRRRLHTTRPYQERLLNMAEARREIVTALKFHRASMKQQQEQQQQQQEQQGQQQVQVQQPLQPSLSIQGKPKSRRTQKNYEPNNYFRNNLSASNFSYCPPPYNPYHSYPVQENPNFMDFALPNQALGLNLNLNLQDFNNLETSIYNSGNYPSIYSSSSSASSSSSSSPPTSSQEGVYSGASSMVEIQKGEIGMHPRMDDKEIAEIKSIGDQHQMELNDTLNLVSSAWWFKFLKSMEIYGNDQKTENEYGSHPFDEIMEFEPAWLNANESCFLQQHLQDYYSDDYFKDPALPCMDMDIQEIEAMDDDEWLS